MTDRLDIFSLPSVAFGEWETIPQKRGVYFFVGADREILYIGKSNNLWRRLRTSHQVKSRIVDKKKTRVYWKELKGDHFAVLAFERKCIQAFNPLLNHTNSRMEKDEPQVFNPNPLNAAFRQTGETVNRFAKQLSVDQNTLRRVLAGKNVTVETLSHVAQSLGVDTGELF